MALDFVKCLLCIYWDNHRIFLLYLLILMKNYFSSNLFQFVKILRISAFIFIHIFSMHCFCLVLVSVMLASYNKLGSASFLFSGTCSRVFFFLKRLLELTSKALWAWSFLVGMELLRLFISYQVSFSNLSF